MIRLCTELLMIGFLASAAHAQSPKHLWVLQEPHEIVQYDGASFMARLGSFPDPRCTTGGRPESGT